jgi:hypothetical protein
VDISWDAQNMVLLTIAIAQISHAVRRTADDTTAASGDTEQEPAGDDDLQPARPLLSALRP